MMDDVTTQRADAEVPAKTSWAWVAFQLTLAAICVVVGIAIPEVYDATGSDQSRPATVVAYSFFTLLALNILLPIALAALQLFSKSKSNSKSKSAEHRPGKYKIWHAFALTTAVAVLLSMSRYMLIDLVSQCLLAIMLIATVGVAIGRPQVRWRIVVLLLCMHGPYLWILRVIAQMGVAEEFPLGMPASLPALLINQWLFKFQYESSLPRLLTCLELVLGVLACFSYWKRYLWMIVFATSLSLCGSFVLHALFRA